MITRITLTNYMSHAHTVIEPAAGLTVILGPNNCGKSAIVSALQTLCGDNSGDFMVRHGEKECAVTVETDDGHTIRWQRSKKSTSYILDGIEVSRTGRGNLPDDLQTLLRLGKVAHPSKDEEFDVHFAQQKSPIFLIDREADTAAFFSTASDAEKLIEMQKLHKTKVADRRRQLVETKNDLAALDSRLTALSPLDDLATHLQSLAEQEKELERLDREIVALEELLEETHRQEQSVRLYQRQSAVIATLQSPPTLAEAQPLADHLERLESARRQVAKAGASAAALSSLVDPPVPHDTKPLQEFLHRLAVAATAVDVTQTRRALLASLTPPPAQEDPAPLADFLARLSAATTAKLNLRNSLDEVTTQLKSIEGDIAAWLWANPNCPTCGQPTSREHFLASHAPNRKRSSPSKENPMPEQMGLLFIGDPHLASRPPGFRKDDYAATILEKLRWCLNYAKENSLRPIFLGDLFDFPRDNANWLLVRLLPLLDDNTLAIYGNHDCKENTLDENDSLSILVHANKIRLLDEEYSWTGTINGRHILIGGTSWGQNLPESFNREHYLSDSSFILHPSSLVFWLAHHDLRFPGHDVFAKLDCREIPGIDYLINGHNHRNLGQVQAGQTLWINPGNISRITRSEISRNHIPSVLRADITAAKCEFIRVPIPHAPFDEVFHAETPGQKPEDAGSVFIRLADFESVRTASGAGLRHFLDANLPQFDPKVADEINALATEVLQDAH